MIKFQYIKIEFYHILSLYGYNQWDIKISKQRKKY